MVDKIIAVSGGFDPLHAGHLAMFKEAAQYGSVTVILNTDAWLIRKKGFVFLPFEERATIIRSLTCVDVVVPADDDDGTVASTLKWLRPHYFANGGDRTLDNTPEKEICEEMGIEQIYNIGGGKANSSSAIAQRAWVERPWGSYKVLDEGRDYKVKKLVIEPGKGISLQRHNFRQENWIVVKGHAVVQKDEQQRAVLQGESVYIPTNTKHKLTNPMMQNLEVIEVQSGVYLGEDDIERFKEKRV